MLHYHAGLDLSGAAGCFALADGEGNLLIDATRPMRGATAEFAPWIAGLLRERSIALTDIGRFTIGSGPGSFSGLRIASALIQGIAYARAVETRAVPTAITRARGVESAEGNRIAVVLDGRNHEIVVFPARKQRGEVVPDGECAVLDAGNVHGFLAENRFDIFVALASDREAVGGILPEPFRTSLRILEQPSAAELIRVRYQPFDGNLVRLDYVRPAVYPREPGK